MSFKIVWTERATNELASVWLNATERDAVTAAAARLERMLSQNPLQERHEIGSGFETALSVPVGIDFGVDPRKWTSNCRGGLVRN